LDGITRIAQARNNYTRPDEISRPAYWKRGYRRMSILVRPSEGVKKGLAFINPTLN